MALDFDGANAKVDHGDVTSAEGANLTVMFWIQQDALAANDEWISKFTSGASGWKTGLSEASGAASITFTIGAGTNYIGTVADVFSAGTWYHVAACYDGSQSTNDTKLVIYLQGVAQTISHSINVPASIVANAVHVTVGSLTAGRAPDGQIAHIKVWNATLTNAEVLNEMNSTRPCRTANLIGWYPYDDGTSAADYSQAGFTGTVTTAVQIAGPPVSMNSPVGRWEDA